MDITTIKGIIRKELPNLIESDPEIRYLILDISKKLIEAKADKDTTNDKFDTILAEIQKDRIDQAKKWHEQNKKWDEQNKKWFEENKRLEELIKLQDKKWQELHKADDDLKKLIATTVGALGARWGHGSEASFRNALKGILEDNFNVSVSNYNEYDKNGEVFGYPDQVELDIIIRDGLLIICEIKSSISNSEMYTFYKKCKFYEKQHNKTANRYIAISPMISDKAKKVAEKLGINIYTNAFEATIF